MTNLEVPQLVKPIAPEDHRIGVPSAPVSLVEYGDYECPFCAEAHAIVGAIVESLGAELCFVYRHFPMRKMHPHAEIAAQAAEAAGAQGRFWEMHDLLFENRNALGIEDLLSYATYLELDIDALVQDLETERFAPKVRSDFISGVQSGVNGTPCFFINGYRYDGSWDEASLTQALHAAARATVR